LDAREQPLEPIQTVLGVVKTQGRFFSTLSCVSAERRSQGLQLLVQSHHPLLELEQANGERFAQLREQLQLMGQPANARRG
jgi:hypothetical protein